MNYWYHRRIIKALRQLLKQASHIRNTMEDIADPDGLRLLEESVRHVNKVMATNDWESMESAGNDLDSSIRRLIPKKSYSVLREHIEIIVVAVAVAMAFRTYFIQPFKIPTSSMAPTLYGIHYEPKAKSGLFDCFPLKLVKLAVLGEWYVDVRAQSSGIVQFTEGRFMVVNGIYHRVFSRRNDRVNYGGFVKQGDVLAKENHYITTAKTSGRVDRFDSGSFMVINDVYHRVFKRMSYHVSNGDNVFKGQLLASGLRVVGDHILVNKAGWNFRNPRRGEIMVFKTNDIDHPQIKPKEHYVKRMVGLPYETLKIDQPYLLINGQRVTGVFGIDQVQNCLPGYSGYQVRSDTTGLDTNHSIELERDEYFACGDNQSSSLDSRYWGAVPKKNLVGPAFFVYWPFSHHWGLIH